MKTKKTSQSVPKSSQEFGLGSRGDGIVAVAGDVAGIGRVEGGKGFGADAGRVITGEGVVHAGRGLVFPASRIRCMRPRCFRVWQS